MHSIQETMTRKLLAAIALSLPVLAGADVRASARLLDPQGRQIGRAELIELKSGVAVVMMLVGVSPGAHAVELRAQGQCGGPGLDSAGVPLAALPDVEANPDGTLYDRLFGAELTLASPGPRSLLRQGSASLVVYEAPGVKGKAPSGRPIACGLVAVRDEDRAALAAALAPRS